MYQTKELSAETLAALVEASAAINSAQDLDKTLNEIASSAAAVMQAEASSVIMLDEARGKQVFTAAFGKGSAKLVGVEYDQKAGISGAVLRSGRPEIVDDVAYDSDHLKDIDRMLGFRTRSLLAVPLMHKGKALGVVEALNPIGGGRFTEKDCQLAQIFANLAAIAVAKSQLCQRFWLDKQGLKKDIGDVGDMVGSSDAIMEVKGLIDRVGPVDSTVLLLGETGTGKELAARMVHARSQRTERPFIAVNCAALPTTLLESELFGHEAGAFTGATGKKLGRFELADGGTIFLDEIAELSLDVQVKLLRVLQEKEIVRVGGTRSIGCDVRVIAATNRNLAEEMQAGRFRKDLYFRLSVFPIEIPPLRERKEDIPLLVEHFLPILAGQIKMPTPTMSPAATDALVRHDFPGNVRELQNVLERGCLLCYKPGDDTVQPRIELEHLPREFINADESGSAEPNGGSALAASEKAMIVNALRASNWNQSKAARALGISRDNIRYRIKKYRIKRPE